MISTPAPPQANANQYIRNYSLIVSGNGLSGTTANGQPFNGYDLSNLKFKFSIKRTDTSTPNTADIRVYNVENTTALQIFSQLGSGSTGAIVQRNGRVLLQAGYNSNYGVIFSGDIYQIILGRENATDTFIDFIAGDAHLAYNFSIVKTQIPAGCTQSMQVLAAANAMAANGVSQGYIAGLPENKLPRGKVLYGNARNYLTSVAQNAGATWSIQNEQLTMYPVTAYPPGTAVVLTSKSGLVGTPQQTNVGVNVKCLLNPLIRPGTRINIAEASVADFKIDISQKDATANLPASYNQDGEYYAQVVEHSGDTRGVEWYTNIQGINTNQTVVPSVAVTVGTGP
jgi:hypothetical protein